MDRRTTAPGADSRGAWLATAPLTLAVLLCCAVPIVWMMWMALDSGAWPTVAAGYRAQLLLRTLALALTSAVVATLLGLPVGIVLGRGRGWVNRLLWLLTPLALLMPSIAFAYGWSQAIRLCDPILRPLGLTFEPASLQDQARCVWTLAAWLWAVPACTIGLALRRADVSVQLQALLDGALLRLTLRQALTPALVGALVVFLLAGQEFAVFEPTGISVIATEMRLVFETGAFSGMALPGRADQAQRAGAAVAVALPVALPAVLVALVALRVLSRRGDAVEPPAAHDRPRALRPSILAYVGALLVPLVCIGVPLVALWRSHRGGIFPTAVLSEFGPAIQGTLGLGAVMVVLSALIATGALVVRQSWLIAIALVAFALGGQLLAIAMIRLFNHPTTAAVYDSAALVVMAYVGRFAWIALIAGASTWNKPWRLLRELAAVDGAGALLTARAVVLPLAWPLLLAAGLLTAALSMTEVPATVLLSPPQPALLVPLLVTWVHMLRYDPMIEASLLLVALVVVPGAVAIALVGLSRRLREIRNQR